MSGSVIGTSRGSFHFLRLPVSQNDCFIEVKLSLFGVHWVIVIALSLPPREQSAQDFVKRCRIFENVFIICYRKIYWPTWN